MAEVPIFRTDLRANIIADPEQAYRVGEGRYGMAQYSPDKPHLLTYTLSACKALAFSEESTKRGLLAHLALVRDLEKVTTGLVNEFGGSLAQTDVYLAMGAYQAKKLRFEDGNWPTIDDLIKVISKHKPGRIFVEDKPAEPYRNYTLDLVAGQLKEIEGLEFWSLMNLHDSTIAKPIVSLDI